MNIFENNEQFHYHHHDHEKQPLIMHDWMDTIG